MGRQGGLRRIYSMYECMHACMWMDGWMDVCVYVCGWMDGCVCVCVCMCVYVLERVRGEGVQHMQQKPLCLFI